MKYRNIHAHITVALIIIFLSHQSFAFANNNGTSATSLGGDFELTDHNGNEFKLSQLRGKLVLLVFGYTSCPDVCPMELTTISNSLKKLNKNDVTAVFVSVDPVRDTVERLNQYVGFFHPNIIGLTGSSDEVKLVADQYDIRYERYGEGANYTMDHSSDIFLIDRAGEIQSISPFGVSDTHLVDAINFLADS